jgi:hypothetical protein
MFNSVINICAITCNSIPNHLDNKYNTADDTNNTILTIRYKKLSKKITVIKCIQKQITITARSNHLTNGTDNPWLPILVNIPVVMDLDSIVYGA